MMPRLIHEQNSLRLKVSAMLQELQCELVREYASEIATRKALLARAVASTEAAIHDMYEAEIDRLRSEWQASDKMSPFLTPRAMAPFQAHSQHLEVLLTPRGVSLGVPYTPQAKDAAKAAIFRPTTSPVAWDFSPNGCLQECPTEKATLTPPPSYRIHGVSKVHYQPLSGSLGKRQSSSQPAMPISTPGRPPAGMNLTEASEKIGVYCGNLIGSPHSPSPLVSQYHPWRTLAQGKAVPSESPCVATSSFVINDASAWSLKLRQEFKGKGTVDDETVVVKDANGFVIDEVTAKDLVSDSRICCLPSFPLNVTYSKSTNCNVCTVSTASPESNSDIQHSKSFECLSEDSTILKTAFQNTGFNLLGCWKSEDARQSLLKKSGSRDLLEDEDESKDGDDNKSTAAGRRDSISSVTSLVGDSALYIDLDSEDCVPWQAMILRPTSMKCISWDTLKSLAVLYDLIFTPLSTFSLPQYMVLMVIDAIISGIWVLDIFVSFLRGYIDEHGVVQMRARTVALRYIGTWFFFDLSVVAIDISLITIKEVASMHGLVSLLPMLRLIRIMKLPSLLNMISELMKLKTNTDKWSFVLRIVSLLAVFLVIIHFVSCGWYAVGQLGQKDDTPSSIQERWLDKHFDDSANFNYRYATCFHWSLTQFTPASMEVTPTNSIERSYNVCIIIFGFVVFSSFVSTMTQSITQLQQASSTEKRAMRDLRRFVADNGLSAETIGKIMSLIHDAKNMVRHRRLHEDSIEALKLLPHTLRQHIRFEMYRSVLESHPLMDEMRGSHLNCFKSLCHNALSQVSLDRGETLFTFGMEGSGMYFVMDGTLHYFLGFNQSIEDVVVGNPEGRVRLCEGSLWVEWSHRGRLVGEQASELILLASNQFAEICSHSVIIKHLQMYAGMFARRALKLHKSAENVKDTWCSDMDANILVDLSFRLTLVAQSLNSRSSILGVAFAAWRDIAAHNRQFRSPLRYLQNRFRQRSTSSGTMSNAGARRPVHLRSSSSLAAHFQ